MTLKSLPDRIATEDSAAEALILDGGTPRNGQIVALALNENSVNQDGSRKREIGDLVQSIQLVRDEMAGLKHNDPRWTACFANLNALLSQRDRLKDS